jgi:hypothetical protein
MTAQKAKWKPSSYRPAMLGNGPSLGFVPLAAVWPWVLRIGLPFIGGASVAALFSSAAKKDEDGSGVPFNWENVGLSTLLGGVGAAGFYVSGVLPEGVKPFGYAASVISVSAAIYFMFQPAKKDSSKAASDKAKTIGPAPIPPANLVPEAPPGWLVNMLQLVPEPDYGGSLGGGTLRSIYFNQPYRLKIFNNTDKLVQFFVGVRIDPEGSTSPIFKSPQATAVKYGRVGVSIPPKGDFRADVMTPSMNSIIEKASFFGSLLQYAGLQTYSGDMAVSFELFDEPSGGIPFMSSEAFTVTYSAWG